MFVIAYVASNNPFRNQAANFIELINEIFAFVAAYPLFTFTTWTHLKETRTLNGWVIISCICANVVFNILVAGLKGL